MFLIVHVHFVFDNILSRCVLVHRRIAIIVSISIIVIDPIVVDTIAVIVVDTIVVIILVDSIIILWRWRILNLSVVTTC